MSGANTCKLLVTGGTGQLATSLGRLSPEDVTIVGRPAFDFDRPDTLTALLAQYRPQLVINAAAWTAVDMAESNIDAAYAANKRGPALIARYCQEAGIPFIHISTDYVFSGDKGAPYTEADPISPDTTYGKSKAEGEIDVLAACPNAVILRTSWVYAPHGKNFVKTMISAGAKNPRLKVVGDQYGNPTNADDLATAVLAISRQLLSDRPHDDMRGIFHAAGSGATSWHGLAVAALTEAAHYGQAFPEEVLSITTADWPTPAKRPHDSRLDCRKLETVFNVKLPEWQTSLKRAVQEIFS